MSHYNLGMLFIIIHEQTFHHSLHLKASQVMVSTQVQSQQVPEYGCLGMEEFRLYQGQVIPYKFTHVEQVKYHLQSLKMVLTSFTSQLDSFSSL